MTKVIEKRRVKVTPLEWLRGKEAALKSSAKKRKWFDYSKKQPDGWQRLKVQATGHGRRACDPPRWGDLLDPRVHPGPEVCKGWCGPTLPRRSQPPKETLNKATNAHVFREANQRPWRPGDAGKTRVCRPPSRRPARQTQGARARAARGIPFHLVRPVRTCFRLEGDRITSQSEICPR